jgi:hypothetical protein
VSPASPPSQPQSHPPCPSCSPLGSLTLDSPIVWLAVVGVAGLTTATAVTIYRRRVRRD